MRTAAASTDPSSPSSGSPEASAGLQHSAGVRVGGVTAPSPPLTPAASASGPASSSVANSDEFSVVGSDLEEDASLVGSVSGSVAVSDAGGDDVSPLAPTPTISTAHSATSPAAAAPEPGGAACSAAKRAATAGEALPPSPEPSPPTLKPVPPPQVDEDDDDWGEWE